MTKEFLVEIVSINNIDTNGGFIFNPFQVGQKLVASFDQETTVGSLKEMGKMLEASGVHGFGFVDFTVKVLMSI